MIVDIQEWQWVGGHSGASEAVDENGNQRGGAGQWYYNARRLQVCMTDRRWARKLSAD
jgi:hypothetical protein